MTKENHQIKEMTFNTNDPESFNFYMKVLIPEGWSLGFSNVSLLGPFWSVYGENKQKGFTIQLNVFENCLHITDMHKQKMAGTIHLDNKGQYLVFDHPDNNANGWHAEIIKKES